MYKKKQWPYLFMALFVFIGVSDIIAQNNPKVPPPPPVGDLIRGNWNHVMDPTGCVVLDEFNELTISVRISVGTPDVTPFDAIFYKTQFQNGDILMDGPITNEMLIPETFGNDCEVYTFVQEVFNESYIEECLSSPYRPISFDYHVSLVDINGDPYPIETNIEMINTCQLISDGGGVILPTLVYEGNHDLCCLATGMGGEGYVVQQNDEFAAMNDKVTQEDDSQVLNSQDLSLTQSVDAQLTVTANAGFSVFPNPFNEALNLRFDANTASNTTVQLWNISGQLMQEWKLDNFENGDDLINLPTDHLPADIYFCKIKNETLSQTLKVVKL